MLEHENLQQNQKKRPFRGKKNIRGGGQMSDWGHFNAINWEHTLSKSDKDKFIRWCHSNFLPCMTFLKREKYMGSFFKPGWSFFAIIVCLCFFKINFRMCLQNKSMILSIPYQQKLTWTRRHRMWLHYSKGFAESIFPFSPTNHQRIRGILLRTFLN